MGRFVYDIRKHVKQNLYLILFDAAVLAIVPFIALLIRLEGNLDIKYLNVLFDVIPYVVAIKLIIFYIYGLYKRLWRYATVQDMFAIMGAVTVGAVLVTFLAFYFKVDLPRSIYIISWIFEIGCICFSRLLIRIVSFMTMGTNNGDILEKKVLIVGAGDAGAIVAREIKQRNTAQQLVGYIDDDIEKIGSKLLGTPILGTSQDIHEIVSKYDIDSIIIAMPSVSGDIIRKIALICRESGCEVKVLPGIYELIDGKGTLQQLRNIEIEDLLRREPVKLDLGEISRYIQDKIILITGAGGSIGSELSRQISKIRPKKIILLGRGENSIYEIHQELKEKFCDLEYIPVIADIRDRKRIDEIFARYKPQVVFHAAAHKHVPLMEAQPSEAVKNNIFGTKNIVEAADRFQVETVIMISTDKAVNPTSVMGATKRVAELIVQNMNAHSKTKYAVVRFGNVLGSRGSVIPLFKKQIAKGGPITITHPDMVRYFMTIPEATQLVLQAGAIAKGSEVFLLDMGEPVRIFDMAKDLVELHGLVPEQDIKFVFTGLRPGEKLYEELLTAEEGAESTHHKKIYKATIEKIDEFVLADCLDKLEKECDSLTIITLIKRIVPTYQSKQLNDKRRVAL